MVNRWQYSHSLEQTPALVIDSQTVQHNVDRLAAYARSHRLNVRPHTKTHKSLRMAEAQMNAGAVGLTAAKVGELEIMQSVAGDLLLAYPAVDPNRCRRLAVAARGEGKTVRVAVDSAEALDNLALAASEAESTVGVLVDLDVGFHRTGVQTPAAALSLAQEVARRRSLRMDGLFFYPGHVWANSSDQTPELTRIDALLAETLDLWTKSGLRADIVSGGSTPTAYQSHLITRQTEIRPGTSIYNDMNTVRGGFCLLDDCAAAVICTVVSTAVPGKVVVDAGTKTLTSDRNITAGGTGHGHVLEYPQSVIIRLSEEHGEIDCSQSGRQPRIGERVTIIPNHICPCVNLQDAAWVMQADGRLEQMQIDARGRLS